MHFRFRGLGRITLLIVVGAFLALRTLFELIFSGPEGVLRQHVNAAALALSGVVIFSIAARADKRNGIDVFSKYAWTTELLQSEHIAFSIPMRHFGLLTLIASSFF